MRFALVQSNLQGRDLGGFVKEIKERIAKEVKLPPGYIISFGGQYENQERAMKRLSIVAPLSFLYLPHLKALLSFHKDHIILSKPLEALGR